MISRRGALVFGGSVAAVTLLGGCAPVARRLEHEEPELPLPLGDVHPTLRLLNRAGFGPRPGDIARVEALGHGPYMEAEYEAGAQEDLALSLQLQRLDVLQIDDPELEDLPREEAIRQLQQAALLRAVHGRNQLLERMVDFWSNHFNIYARKGDGAFRLGADERDVIRGHALGRFQDLLRSSAHSPAMLAYLDNPQNLSGHPNENYAREVMELHTLGIGGGYTQKDVQEVARCFTGWTIEDRFLRPKGRLRFVPERHDDGSKLVLGHLIPAGGGEKDVDQVLDILASHPSTSRFIAGKLVRQIYGEENRPLIDLVAAAYRSSGGDIPSMLRPILQPSALTDAPPVLKRPFEYIVSAIRATGGFTDGGSPLQTHLAKMGEPLYQWPMPDGYPVKTVSWTGNMLPRWNFAYELASGHIGGSGMPEAPSLQVLRLSSADAAERQGRGAIALRLASPGFQWA